MLSFFINAYHNPYNPGSDANLFPTQTFRGVYPSIHNWDQVVKDVEDMKKDKSISRFVVNAVWRSSDSQVFSLKQAASSSFWSLDASVLTPSEVEDSFVLVQYSEAQEEELSSPTFSELQPEEVFELEEDTVVAKIIKFVDGHPSALWYRLKWHTSWTEVFNESGSADDVPKLKGEAQEEQK